MAARKSVRPATGLPEPRSGSAADRRGRRRGQLHGHLPAGAGLPTAAACLTCRLRGRGNSGRGRPGVTGSPSGTGSPGPGSPGSYAEQALVPGQPRRPVPGGLDLEVAAAVMLQGMTAHYLCHRTYPVQPGDTAVVHAAAGGVGLLLTQMVVMRGGIVIGDHLHHRQGRARPGGGGGTRSPVMRISPPWCGRSPAGRRGRGLRRRRPGHLRRQPRGAAPRGYMVLYGASSGPVPPFDPQRLNTGGSLFLTRPTLGAYIATVMSCWAGRRPVRLDRERPAHGAYRRQIPAGRRGPGPGDLAARRTTGKLLLLPG